MPHPAVSQAGPLGQFLTRVSVFLSHPGAFVAASVYVVVWALLHPQTFEWHAGVTIAALFMTLFIQRATHRDTQALHAKMDELLQAHGRARNDVALVDEAEPEDIEESRRRDHEKIKKDGDQ